MRAFFNTLCHWLVAIGLLVSTYAVAETKTDSADVGLAKRSFVDNSRTIDPAFDFPGAENRRVDVTIWYPASSERTVNGEGHSGTASTHQWPLIIYSHGTYGYPGNAMHLVNHLVGNGYIVAAPAFPLTSRESFAEIPMAMGTDVVNQPADISFVVDQLLQDGDLGELIDGDNIGVIGHSLGAVTDYFLSFGVQTRDPRIGANALLGAGDPVQAVLAFDFGFDGVQHAPISTPVLFLSAQHDVFANLTGRPFAAYSRVEPPKQEILITGGNHIWFRDGNEQHPKGKNPDCLFFEKSAPGMLVPGCQAPVDLIDSQVQQQITRQALLYFFNAYLQDKPGALQKLHAIESEFAAARIRYEE